VTVPEWQFPGAETLRQAEPQRVKIGTKVAEKGDLPAKNHAETKREKDREDKENGPKVSAKYGLSQFHGWLKKK
jgi:hypothetical protein